ncbi:MAG: Ig-like domain-containing protein, partial [Bacteroidales bacterium]|nr:Ig-like domain-containing protein [Bacteroidales bacterium]
VAGDTTVMVGDSLQVLASVDPSNAADTTLTWSVDNESIATVDASTGMLTGISVGAVTVKATALDGSGVADSIEIAVLPVPVESIDLLAPNDSVAVGGNITISAEVLPDTATIKTVAWSLINDTTASSVLNGVLTAGTEGTVWVKATATDGSDVADSLSFVIYQPVLVNSIQLTAPNDSVIAGQDITIAAEVLPGTAENKEVTWSLINDITSSSITDGVLTAGTPGTVWVKATASDGSNVADSLSITVYLLDTVFHFAFDGNLDDVSGSNVQITTPKGTGFFTTDSTGVNGNAIAFDGVVSHNYLQINELGLLDPNVDDFTACAWVKITSDVTHAATHVLLHQTEPATTPKGTGQTRWYLGVEGSGPNGSDTLRVGSWVGGGITTSEGIIPRNEWVHIAVVGTTSDDKLKYYINGEFSSEETPPSAFEASTKGFIIGNHRASGNAGSVWDGLVDDLYLLRKALTAAELRVIAGIDTDVKVDSIDLTAPNDSVATGGNITITATVLPDTATNKTVT